jgi:putative NADPH-quinone reductase
MVTGTRHVVILQGHPDPQHRHFCHALADAYAAGARGAGHEVVTVEVVTVDVARLDFTLERSREDLSQ